MAGSKGGKKKKKKVARQNYYNEKDKKEKQMKMNLQQWERIQVAALLLGG